MLALCAAMRVEPKLRAVRPSIKGEVTGVEQGNRLLTPFIAEIAHVRPTRPSRKRIVGEAFAVERARLLALPEPRSETARVEPIKRLSISTPIATRCPATTHCGLSLLAPAKHRVHEEVQGSSQPLLPCTSLFAERVI